MTRPLLICDIQSKFVGLMDTKALAAFQTTLDEVLGMGDHEVAVTEQVPDKFGSTIEISALKKFKDVVVKAKTEFNAAPSWDLRPEDKIVTIVGFETHICMFKTIIDIAGRGIDVVLNPRMILSLDWWQRAIALATLKSVKHVEWFDGGDDTKSAPGSQQLDPALLKSFMDRKEAVRFAGTNESKDDARKLHDYLTCLIGEAGREDSTGHDETGRMECVLLSEVPTTASGTTKVAVIDLLVLEEASRAKGATQDECETRLVEMVKAVIDQNFIPFTFEAFAYFIMRSSNAPIFKTALGMVKEWKVRMNEALKQA